jgi:hypothetical protein
VFDYNPDTGTLTNRKTGRVVRGKLKGGYLTARYNGKVHLNHRLIWQIVTGEVPIEIDHINGIKDDNRWCNLRLATRSQNMMNQAVAGVSFHKASGKWNPYIQVNGKQTSLGLFNNYDDAKQARQRAEETYFGDYKHTPI